MISVAGISKELRTLSEKEHIMVMSANKLGSLCIASQLEEIRGSWTPAERQCRADLGRQRQEELLMLLDGIPSDPDHWAVGAPAIADIERMAG